MLHREPYLIIQTREVELGHVMTSVYIADGRTATFGTQPLRPLSNQGPKIWIAGVPLRSQDFLDSDPATGSFTLRIRPTAGKEIRADWKYETEKQTLTYVARLAGDGQAATFKAEVPEGFNDAPTVTVDGHVEVVLERLDIADPLVTGDRLEAYADWLGASLEDPASVRGSFTLLTTPRAGQEIVAVWQREVPIPYDGTIRFQTVRDQRSDAAFDPEFSPKEQATDPVEVFPLEASVATNAGTWFWVFRDAVYSTVERLTSREVKALLTESENRRRSRVAQALRLMDMAEAPTSSVRALIPNDVKIFVWQRDSGRCVRCGSNQNLEFDHIIPIVMGGSNTARNLQLLCEACNRAKGGNLV